MAARIPVKEKHLTAPMTPLTQKRHNYREALKATHGNMSLAGQKLGVSRQAVWAVVQNHPELQKLIFDERQSMVDLAETALRGELLNGNITAIIYTLKSQGKDRGWAERQELVTENKHLVELAEREKEYQDYFDKYLRGTDSGPVQADGEQEPLDPAPPDTETVRLPG